MANKLLLLCLLLFSVTMYGLEGAPIEDGSDSGEPFAEGTMLPRMLASASNYTVYVPSVKNGLVVSNPGLERASFYLVGVTADGTHSRRFMMVEPGDSRTLSPKILSFAEELYVISLQPFEAGIPETRSGQVESYLPVRVPTNPLFLFQVEGDNGTRTTVGKDTSDVVFFPAHPCRAGLWDPNEQLVLQDDGTVLRRLN